ncbi:BNR repeat-containing protein [bacterium]|nr:BNR repeat-containing protein [bacterium]
MASQANAVGGSLSNATDLEHSFRRNTFIQWMIDALIHLLVFATSMFAGPLPAGDGFNGIWYSNGNTRDQYVHKYSGGLGTYPQQTAPIAIFESRADRTYFLYGGTNPSENVLKNFISYYDHIAKRLARPRQLRHVGGNDIHMNATLAIDDRGYLWVFANSHGDGGRGNLYKSSKPYEIDAFEEVPLPAAVFGNAKGAIKLSYTDPVYVPERGLMLIWNQYHRNRSVWSVTSPNGLMWDSSRSKQLVNVSDEKGRGSYQIARANGAKVCVVTDFHPEGLDHRTNLYYLESSDFGQSWKTASGQVLDTPLKTATNPALIFGYHAEQKMVYMKDLNFDEDGRPVILYLTVSDADGKGHLPGPERGERTLHTAQWNGLAWVVKDVFTTDHNYDHGELYIEQNGLWRVIGPYIDGPQKFGTGGEVGVWISSDRGDSWKLTEQWTSGSNFNHTYVRRPLHASPDFYAIWADGHAFKRSASRIYFATMDGHVFQMPTRLDAEWGKPQLIRSP